MGKHKHVQGRVGKSLKPKAKSKDVKLNKSAEKIAPTIPFEFEHRILLVGEGDFSFARSLLDDHGCVNLHATSFDSRETVLEKYPQAAQHLRILTEEPECGVEFNVDAKKLGQPGVGGGGKKVKRGKFDRIVFNFPHVGGLSTDVNRQVRANQELLVGFFEKSARLLGNQGKIIVTIFEGEPYTLWNIRTLARHAGLGAETSFAFRPEAYPRYGHVRTLGNIEGGGAWKGEERRSRSYVFRPVESLCQTKRDDSDSD